jgi:small redox-active disulfide protein 2
VHIFISEQPLEGIMIIKVFGPGCAKCKQTEEVVHKAVTETGVEAMVEKVSDIQAILALGILSTPAVTVDGAIKLSGRVPTVNEVKQWLEKEIK